MTPPQLIVESAFHQREFKHRYFSMLVPTSELVTGTSSYGTPEAPNHHDDERPPPRSSAFDAAVSADAASPRSEHTLLVKRTIRVSHSSSAASAPPARRGASKRQKTTAAREDLCCFCSVGGSCTARNCPCAKVGRPCRCCDPGSCNRCSNTLEAHNRTISAENYRRSRGIAARFRVRVGRELEPQIPLSTLAPLWRMTMMRTNWDS